MKKSSESDRRVHTALGGGRKLTRATRNPQGSNLSIAALAALLVASVLAIGAGPSGAQQPAAEPGLFVTVGLGANAPNGDTTANGYVESQATDTFETTSWTPLYWSDYEAANGETRPALCDVDGTGPAEMVVGLGSYPANGGWIAIQERIVGQPWTWLRIPWQEYNDTNGETHIACGDIDGDTREEIVVGLGSGGRGWVYIFDDATTGYAPYPTADGGWLSLGWSAYADSDGATHPAVGNIDGDGAEEIAIATGVGGDRWLRTFDDASASFAPLDWRRAPLVPGTATDEHSVWPAVCDGSLVLGSSSSTGQGGGGWVSVIDPATNDLAGPEWFQVPWYDYHNASGATAPSCGDIDGDGNAEIAVGLDGQAARGYYALFDDLANSAPHIGWPRVHWSEYNDNVGSTRPAIFSPPNTAIFNMNVMSITFLPVDPADASKWDQSRRPAFPQGNSSLSGMRSHIASAEDLLIDTMEAGSRSVKGSGRQSLNYTMLNRYEFAQHAPPGQPYNGRNRPAYDTILDTMMPSELGTDSFCDYVDRYDITEVWLWTDHDDVIEPLESQMSSPAGKPYLDISNSGAAEDRLPHCDHTYILYNFNFTRRTEEATHNHLHQLENILGYNDLNAQVDKDLFDWEGFGDDPINDAGHRINAGSWANACGDSHWTPNVVRDPGAGSFTEYDYDNPLTRSTDCTNWNPQGSGVAERINCSAWSCDELEFYIWWMQRIPGDANGLSHNGDPLRNWWVVFADYDAVSGTGSVLTETSAG